MSVCGGATLASSAATTRTSKKLDALVLAIDAEMEPWEHLRGVILSNERMRAKIGTATEVTSSASRV